MSRNKYPEETVNLIIDEAMKLFIVKGYDNTSIQDIIDNLGGLTKGAVYHHFKSKDKIFEGVCNKISKQNHKYYTALLSDTSKSGLEKIRYMITGACLNPVNDSAIAVMAKATSDPKFLKMQLKEIFEVIAPVYALPIIEAGIKDGSIVTDYPREVAEVSLMLLNMWTFPFIVTIDEQDISRRVKFLRHLFASIGVDAIDDTLEKQLIFLYMKHRKILKTIT